MASSMAAVTGQIPRPCVRWRRLAAGLLVLAAALTGCAGSPVDSATVSGLPPLQLADATLTVADAANRVPRADLLSLDEPMRQFVARYTLDQANQRLRLMSLHQAVRGAGGLDMQYDPSAEGTAREVFQRGSANCLSYANLFVALAREAGLDASYQWVEVRPQWSRVGERVQIALHVNVLVRLRDGTPYMVDIDPLPARKMAGARGLTDAEAEALYYNNIAMDALGRQELATAWYYLLRALQQSPANAHLWVNLGALYRANGQHREAEQSYLRALDLDGSEYSAMTNLAVLYGLEGRLQEQAYWLDRVEGHRQANPYYHAWQGDEAAAAGDWHAALLHYDRAVALLPNDGHLLFSRGLIHYQLGDLDAAALDMERAIEVATLQSEIADYRRQLDVVRKARLAGAWLSATPRGVWVARPGYTGADSFSR